MWRFTILFCIVFLDQTALFAQKDYYATFSTYKYGVELVVGGDYTNAKLCRVNQVDKILDLSPNEVKEYGFKDGRVFKSFEVQTDDTCARFFLERLVKGKLNLYILRIKYQKSKYFITDNDSVLVQLPSDIIKGRKLLDSITASCIEIKPNIQYVKTGNKSLKHFIKGYNNCKFIPLPTIHYGIAFGVSSITFQATGNNTIYNSASISAAMGYTVSAFVDFPINGSAFSFHPEIVLYKNSIADTFTNEMISYDFEINNYALQLPLLLRYNFMQKGISPYFQFGPLLLRTLGNNDLLLKHQYIENSVVVDVNDNPIVQSLEGFAFGGGINWNLTSRIGIFADVRYCYLLNLLSGYKNFKQNEISFKCGLYF